MLAFFLKTRFIVESHVGDIEGLLYLQLISIVDGYLILVRQAQAWSSHQGSNQHHHVYVLIMRMRIIGEKQNI